MISNLSLESIPNNGIKIRLLHMYSDHLCVNRFIFVLFIRINNSFTSEIHCFHSYKRVHHHHLPFLLSSLSLMFHVRSILIDTFGQSLNVFLSESINIIRPPWTAFGEVIKIVFKKDAKKRGTWILIASDGHTKTQSIQYKNRGNKNKKNHYETTN